MIRTCRGGSRAVLRQKIRTRNTTPRGREHAGDDDGAGDQQRVARRDAARRPRNRPWRRRRPEWRRLPMHGGPPGRVPGPRLRHAPRGRRDHRHRDPDPVMFRGPKKLYRASREEVPEGEVLVPLGEAAVRRPGKDVSLIAYGYMAQVCLEAATKAAAKGVEAEVIDLRTLVPLDEPAVLASVKKTGRAVVVYEAPRTAGLRAESSAILADKASHYLRGPIVRVTGFDTPFPYALEDVYLPNSDRVLAAIDKGMAF